MDAFIAIVIAVVFVAILLGLLIVGARYLKIEKETDQGPSELQSSRDKPEYEGRVAERDAP
jgi:membrane protein involved in colicin uptake